MIPFAFACAGARLEAMPEGALYWPARRLLAVADLHLEKGSSYAVNARKMVPRHDTRQTLASLAALIDRLKPETVVCLGDSFHDRAAAERLPAEERAEIVRLTSRTRFVWIAGNHDPAPPPEGWGEVAEEIDDAPLVFRHEARFGPVTGEISGHFHPKVAVRIRGRRITRRCFAVTPHRIVLPAFGALTGGLDVEDPAFAAAIGGPLLALVPTPDRLLRFPVAA